MPSYDPVCHYEGTSDTGHGRTAHIVCASPLPSDRQTVRRAMLGATLLAIMDYGFAGSYWKQTYDAAAAADSALPETETNRYLNGVRLVNGAIDTEENLLHSQQSGAP